MCVYESEMAGIDGSIGATWGMNESAQPRVSWATTDTRRRVATPEEVGEHAAAASALVLRDVHLALAMFVERVFPFKGPPVHLLPWTLRAANAVLSQIAADGAPVGGEADRDAAVTATLLVRVDPSSIG